MKSLKTPSILVAAAIATTAMTTSCGTQLDTQRLTAAGTTATQAMTITDQQLAPLVEKSIKQMDATNQVASASNAYTTRLKRLVGVLEGNPDFPLNFKVYVTPDVNAFASPDGSVRVYSGLMDIMTDDELIGIIGHEIGHVALNHSRNAYRNQLLTVAARQGLGSAGGLLQTLSDSMLGDIGVALVNARYSKNQEREADDFAYEFLIDAGRSPWNLVQAFEKFQSLEGQQAQSMAYVQKMFSSHPETQERIDRISTRALADGIEHPTAAQSK